MDLKISERTGLPSCEFRIAELRAILKLAEAAEQARVGEETPRVRISLRETSGTRVIAHCTGLEIVASGNQENVGFDRNDGTFHIDAVLTDTGETVVMQERGWRLEDGKPVEVVSQVPQNH